MKHGGTIDKYMGDGVMALFPADPAQSILAAFGIEKELSNWNTNRREKRLLEIRVGMGLHYGDVQVGIIGDDYRLNGTVISDAVNVAARLEDLTRNFGGGILLSAELLQHTTPPEGVYRELGTVYVRGRVQGVSVVQAFRKEDRFAPNRLEQEEFIRLQKALREGEWKEAKARCVRLLRHSPDDRTVRDIAHRIQRVTESLQGVKKIIEPYDWIKR